MGKAQFSEIDVSKKGLATFSWLYKNLYVAEFPDADERESLANMKRYLALKAKGWYGKNNYHIIVVEVDGVLVGGSVVDYLAGPNVGVIEFLFISSKHRSTGLGKALMEETIRVLKQDAVHLTGKRLSAVIAEMNDPFRRPGKPDNMDPFQRLLVASEWGFQKLHFPYVQPALSNDQAPVECLILVARLFGRSSATDVRANWVLSIVGEYMRWAMRIKHPTRNRQYQEMAHFLVSCTRIPLVPLRAYVGQDCEESFRIEEIDDAHPSFRSTLRLLRQEISVPSRVASERQFMAVLASHHRHDRRYHLWSICGPESNNVEGMASFFTFRSFGFGGYIVLSGALRGKGLLRQLVARIEARMIGDNTKADGWYIECDSESAPIFHAVGFSDVPVEYQPPALNSRVNGRRKSKERLNLLYKVFGSVYGPPRLTRRFILSSIETLLKHIYEIETPRTHECYRLASAPPLSK